MFEGKTIGVVIPCHNEAKLIGTVMETVPKMVDRIFIVDDASKDATVEIAERYAAERPELIRIIRHERNRGAGAAVTSGYEAAIEERMDITVVINGDAQMDPDDMSALVGPVARGGCDYAKGNRLFTGDAWRIMPRHRYLGNSALSLMTKIASGYWHVADSQTGYTAITLKAIETIDLQNIYPRYGYPNDMLVHLNVFGFRVHDVPVRPIYGVGEQSGIRLWSVIPRLTWLLFHRFWWRMFHKYVIHDTHPLVLFYIMGNIFIVLGMYYGLSQVVAKFRGVSPAIATTVLAALLLISGLQFVFFAMWFDMDYNKEMH